MLGIDTCICGSDLLNIFDSFENQIPIIGSYCDNNKCNFVYAVNGEMLDLKKDDTHYLYRIFDRIKAYQKLKTLKSFL